MTDPIPRPNGNGLTLSGWGATIRAQGRDVIVIVLLGIIAAIAWTGSREVVGVLTTARAQQVHEHQAILDAQNNLACVFLMSPEQRPHFSGDPRKICDYLAVLKLSGK